MATVNFLYRSKRNNSTLNLRLLYRENDKDFVLGVRTKLEVSKEYWDKYHYKKNSKDIDIRNKQMEINNELNKIENHILSSFNEEVLVQVDKEWLKYQMNLYYNPPQKSIELPKELLTYFDFYIEDKKNSLANQTLKNYNVLKKLLFRYESSIRKIILISDINMSFKNNFENYCINEGYAINTISRAFHSVKSICLHAKYNGLETSYQLEKLKLKEVKVETIYLTFDDLEKIELTALKQNHLINAKDWLIISCYIGQRVSDLMRLTSKDIRIEKGKSLVEFTQKKTNKLMTVPLHPKVLEILSYRNGEFPNPISSQKYNDYIKLVCKEAKLNEKVNGSKKVETENGSKKYRKQSGIYEKWELITSHIGRRSFATNFYGKIPTSYLIYVTGHSTEKMFLSYIGKSNKDLAMELINYF